MARSKDVAIRFGVGDPTGLRSSIWRVWAQDCTKTINAKSDVYLSARPLAGAFKVSLHESGEWQFSLTSEYATTVTASGRWTKPSRHVSRWQRPSEISPGITLAFRIYIPSSELRPLPGNVSSRPNVTWISAPPTGYATEFAFFYTRPETLVSSWPGRRSMNTQLLANVPLASGETFWIVYRVQEVPQSLADQINSLRSHVNHAQRLDSDESVDLGDHTLRAILFGNEADGSRLFIEASINPA